MIGLLAGTSAGVALSSLTVALVPGVGALAALATGVLFGAFNGALIGLVVSFDGR